MERTREWIIVGVSGFSGRAFLVQSIWRPPVCAARNCDTAGSMGCPEDANESLSASSPALRLARDSLEEASVEAPAHVPHPPHAESNLVCMHQSVCALNLDTKASKHRVSLCPLKPDYGWMRSCHEPGPSAHAFPNGQVSLQK